MFSQYLPLCVCSSVLLSLGASAACKRATVNSPILTYGKFLEDSPDVANLLGDVSKRSLVSDLIRSVPCLDDYRRRHPTAQRLAGSLLFDIRISGNAFRIESVAPLKGNIDYDSAQCLQRAFKWASQEFPTRQERSRERLVEWDISMSLPPKKVPHLPVDWRSPIAWDQVVTANPDRLPLGWQEYVENIRRTAERALAAAVGTDENSSEALSFSDFRRHYPVLARKVYASVAQVDAYDRIQKSPCLQAFGKRSLFSAQQITGHFHAVFDVHDGTAELTSFRFIDGQGDTELAECVREFGGWPKGPVDVPGQRDGIYRLDWKYRYTLLQ